MNTRLMAMAFLLVSASIPSAAEAGLRDRCAASTGTWSGSAFKACVRAGVSRGEGRENISRAEARARAGCSGTSRRRNLMNPNC
jgi:hypothetical protein